MTKPSRIRSWRNGGAEIAQTGRKSLKVTLWGVVLAMTLLGTSAQAGGITQLEYLQWLVQLSGDTAEFSQTSAPNDYVNWARARGMNPSGGWNAKGKLTREVLGESLVQFLRLSPGKQDQAIRILARHGIYLPSGEVSRSHLSVLVDNDLQPRHSIFRRKKSPPKPDRDRDQDRDVDRDDDRDVDRDDDRNGGRDDDDRGGPPPPPPPGDRDDDREGPSHGDKDD